MWDAHGQVYVAVPVEIARGQCTAEAIATLSPVLDVAALLVP
jgi:hypothetical protein